MKPMDEIKTTNLLLIEASPADAARLQQVIALETPAGSWRLDQAADLQAGLNCLLKGSYDAVLLDLDLPDSQGRQF